jgi:hypothetical protein
MGAGERASIFFCGATAMLLVVAALYVVSFESMLPKSLECVVRSADGCMVWQHTKRVQRYTAGLAGS